MYCKHCQTNNPEGSTHCLNCGNPLEVTRYDASLPTDAPKVPNWKLLEHTRIAEADGSSDEPVIREISDSSLAASNDEMTSMPNSDFTPTIDIPAPAPAAPQPQYARRAAPGRPRPAGYVPHPPVYYDQPVYPNGSTYPSHSNESAAAQSSSARLPKRHASEEKIAEGKADQPVSYLEGQEPKKEYPQTYKSYSDASSSKHSKKGRKTTARRRWIAAGEIVLGGVVLVGTFMLGQYTGAKMYSQQVAHNLTSDSSQSQQNSVKPSSLPGANLQDDSSIAGSQADLENNATSKPQEGQENQDDSHTDSQKESSQQAQSTQPDPKPLEPIGENPAPAVQIYIPYEVMNVRSEPKLDEAFRLGTIPAGQPVEIVETMPDPEVPGIVWGKMSNGQYICLSDGEHAFCVPENEFIGG